MEKVKIVTDHPLQPELEAEDWTTSLEGLMGEDDRENFNYDGNLDQWIVRADLKHNSS